MKSYNNKRKLQRENKSDDDNSIKVTVRFGEDPFIKYKENTGCRIEG